MSILHNTNKKINLDNRKNCGTHLNKTDAEDYIQLNGIQVLYTDNITCMLPQTPKAVHAKSIRY